MESSSFLAEILTEYDEDISGELNIDPLGLLVIWSSYGQNIFRRRISSISNDVRNYTLNLFNHAVIRALMEDDGLVLGKGLRGDPAYAGQGKRSMAFKQACLIYLENVFTYTMIDGQNSHSVETTGVLGISKARQLWEKSQNDPILRFSGQPRDHILKRQNSLGVSGRYKTPLVEMNFFDHAYDYALPASRAQWETVHQQLLAPSKPLARLYKLVIEHLSALLASADRVPKHFFSELPADLKRALIKAFRSPPAVGQYARDFWLAVTGLNQGAAGGLYEVLDADRGQKRTTAEVFAQAAKNPQLSDNDKAKLQHVRLLEPFLAEVDLLLTVMLTAKSQSLDDAAAQWQSLERNARTLPDRAAPITAHAAMRAQASGTAAGRLGELLALARGGDMRQQMQGLLQYHDRVMLARKQSPWLRLVGARQLNVDVRPRPLPTKENRPLGAWVHHYYLPQFRHLLSGLRGAA